MKSILNGVLGQEGNAISVKVKDTFFHFRIWYLDLFMVSS